MNNHYQKGGILVMVLMVLFVLLLFSMTFYYLTTSQIIMVSHQEDLNRVKIGAESAISFALSEYRLNATDKIREFVTAWNLNNYGDPLFVEPHNAPSATVFIQQYETIIQKMFEDYGNPMEESISIDIQGYDMHQITDLDTYLVVSNVPITINRTHNPLINARWGSYSPSHDWGARGDVTFTDSEDFAVEITIPYRIVAMAGTEEINNRYSSTFTIMEEGELRQSINKRILNQWVLCSERHRSTNTDPDQWRDAVWFVGFHNFMGPVHTNDHHNIWGNHSGAALFTQLTSANRFDGSAAALGITSYNHNHQDDYDESYLPMGAWHLRGRTYTQILNPSSANRVLPSHYEGHRPVVTNNPDGYHDRPLGFIDTVVYPENTHDQRLRAVCSISDDDSGINWASFSNTTVNVDAGQWVSASYPGVSGSNVRRLEQTTLGGIYVPGNARYVHFGVASTRTDAAGNYESTIRPWQKETTIRYEDAGGNTIEETIIEDIDFSPIHRDNNINNSLGLAYDNGYQFIEVRHGNRITQVLVQDEDYVLAGTHHQNTKTYVRSRTTAETWANKYWREYDGALNGMLYVHGQLGTISGVANSTGLCGVISGNLKPVFATDGSLYYTSDSRWNVTALEDIIIEGNILYSYYGNPNAITYHGEAKNSFNSTSLASPYRYGDYLDDLTDPNFDALRGRDFYVFDNTLFLTSGDGSLIHQNMIGILTTGGDIIHNPNLSTQGGQHLYIDAFLMAVNPGSGLITVYERGHTDWGHNGPVRLRGGYLSWLYGAHISNNRGFERNFVWDQRASLLAPPYWPIEQAYNDPPRPFIYNSKRKPVREIAFNWPPDMDSGSDFLTKGFDDIL